MRATILFLAASTLLMPACATKSDMNADMAMTNDKTIAEVAMSTGMHDTLVTALKAAGLADMMMQPGEYTVFAPTDAAFAKLPAGTVDSLLRPENRDKLRALLQYHVVPGRVSSSQVATMSTGRSVSGASIPIKTMNGRVMVGGAEVVKADVMASNGVIHVVDTVLMPPGM